MSAEVVVVGDKIIVRATTVSRFAPKTFVRCETHSAVNLPAPILKYNDNKTKLQGPVDICTVDHPIATGDDISAWQLCESQFPWNITSAVPGKKTRCVGETGLICDKDWFQLYGRCYQLKRKMMTYRAARKHCKRARNGGVIAYLHKDYMIHYYRRFDRGIGALWLDASESVRDSLLFGKGDKILLAVNGYPHRVRSGSMIKSDGETDKGFALCEYTPDPPIEK